MDTRAVDLRARCGAFGLPMSRVSDDELDGIARELFEVPDSEPDAETAIARMTKKQRSRAARMTAPAIIARLHRAHETAHSRELDDDEQLVLNKCRATARRMEPGDNRDRVVEFIARVFGPKSVARLLR